MNILRTYKRNIGSAEYEVTRMQKVIVVDDKPTNQDPCGMYQVENPTSPFHGVWFRVNDTWTGERVVSRVTKDGGLPY